MTELALDHDERTALVRHLDCMSVTRLVGRDAAGGARRGVGRQRVWPPGEAAYERRTVPIVVPL